MGVSARRQRWGLLFTVPAVAFFAIFFLLPLGQTAYLSFTDYPLLGDPTWVGTDNYTALVHDRIFRESLITTGWYVVASAVPVSVLAIAMALVLQHPGRTRAVLTAAYFLPVVLSDVVVAIVWRYLLGQFGPINQALSVVDKGGLNLTADPELVPWTVVGITVWQWTGWTMLIYLAGLRTIPANVYEASRIDGANAWQTFRDITFPLLRPTIFFVVAISVITGAQSFGYQYIIS
ncbi:MAG: sugar ABC transporter permease, partial [Chloroflexota bacterium]|nr:sugar ABC transporter permease [Chloroflexota bacterium]